MPNPGRGMYRMSHERCLSQSGPAFGQPRHSCARGSAMGRGRAKAKQTKVARELKYHSPNTDLDALQRELSGRPAAVEAVDDEPDEFDRYASYDPDDEDDDASWAQRK